ncbi:hypothetical protein MMC11_000850 [Xylographa trunciseda]|nr:hypothetical protein [Xylographa trunciseda]
MLASEADKENIHVLVAEDSLGDPLGSGVQYPTSWRLVMTLLALALGTLLMALDTTIISVAIPKISTEFKALNDVGWYGSGYLITLTAFQPVSGNAYRMFHPKVVYMAFIVVFEAAFIVGRTIAGLGAAGILQGALGIVTYIAPLDKRPFYMSIVISVFGVSMCAAPVIGGALTDRVGWRWCFWMSVIAELVFVVKED